MEMKKRKSRFLIWLFFKINEETSRCALDGKDFYLQRGMMTMRSFQDRILQKRENGN